MRKPMKQLVLWVATTTLGAIPWLAYTTLAGAAGAISPAQWLRGGRRCFSSSRSGMPPRRRARWPTASLGINPCRGAGRRVTELATPLRSPADVPSAGDGRANTIDHGATPPPLRFLALVATRSGRESAHILRMT